ncbi:MAG: aryl-sulfate sulfotransferase [Taibaiella sp.]|nr:aryl-sulfate sulfotransferase [Taibaiella sp.]
MNKVWCVLLILNLIAGKAFSQIMPAEEAKVHYRIIGFSFPEVDKTQKYTLEIARGNHTAENPFKKGRVVTKEGTTNKIVAEVPAFGTEYTWRVVAKGKTGNTESPFYHFSTLAPSFSDSGNTRLRVVSEAAAYRDAYVLLDCSKAMYDMKGNMVWFVPPALLIDKAAPTLSDLKLTSQGTITYLHDAKLYEINYNGEIVKKISVNDTPLSGYAGSFHHEGTRLKNGHFMVLSNNKVFWKVSPQGVIKGKKADSSGEFQTNVFGTLNEYDEQGKLVWQFNSSDYVLHGDSLNKRTPDGKLLVDGHVNAFYFDDQMNYVYLGFRNTGRILKIQYPGGKIVAVYGSRNISELNNPLQKLFCEQHAIRIRDGNLYLFNNNGCNSNPVPKLMILEEAADAQVGLKKVWEYECDVEVVAGVRSRGGNIIDLPDGEVFGSLSEPYSDLIIVDRQKTLLWKAVSEKWDVLSNSWVKLPTYRASMIPSAAHLNDIIWYKN